MKVAIYSRKSKFTGKGESVENQIQLCKEYGQTNLRVTEFLVYEDEGFSGKNMDRPEFQRLLSDAKKKKFDVLICYRLDRISRNIADFSTLIDELQKLSIDFVSIREQFDTSTPMGRAMMYIASVFAQLERETIAERVKDNMLELSKTGRWLGGPTPFGFTSERVEEDGKEVSFLKHNDDIQLAAEIFQKYIELGSISRVQKYFFNEYGKKIILSTIRQVLTAPYYVKSTEQVINFMKNQGITVIGEPNGHGLVSYNKRPNGSTKRSNPSSEWIYAVSRHEGIIDGESWIRAQKQLQSNFKTPRASSSAYSYLTGLLRCGKCGSALTLNYNHTRKDGSKIFYYVCEGKRHYGIEYCNNSNIRMDELDQNVIDYLEAVSADEKAFDLETQNKRQASSLKKETDKIKKNILKNDLALINLSKRLAIVDEAAANYVVAEINRVSKDNSDLKSKLLELEDVKENIQSINNELFYEQRRNFPKAFAKCKTVEEKRNLIRTVVKKIYWDSSTDKIKVELLE